MPLHLRISLRLLAVFLVAFLAISIIPPKAGTADVAVAAPTMTGAFTVINYPNLAYTGLFEVDDEGLVVGQAFGDSVSRAFTWQNGSFSDLSYPNARTTVPTGLNNSGRIVGYFTEPASNSIAGSFELSNSVYSAMPWIPGVNVKPSAEDVNDFNDVVGSYYYLDQEANGSVDRGFIYRNGVYTELNIRFPGSRDTRPAAINNAGDVVGLYKANVNSQSQGFIRRNGQFTSISFPGATATELTGINDLGQITGRAWVSNYQYFGFLLKDGTFTTISYPGATETQALGINNNGVIVGWFRTVDGTTSGFLYQENSLGISGRVATPTGSPVAGVTMTLGGSSQGIQTTDADGNYTFSNLTSGGTYTVTPSMTNRTFSPPSQTFSSINGPQTANFAAIGTYDLTVTSFEPVQSVFYPAWEQVALVPGKALAAKVEVKVDGLAQIMADLPNEQVRLTFIVQGLTILRYVPKSEFIAQADGSGILSKMISLPAPMSPSPGGDVEQATVEVIVPGGAESNTNNNSRSRSVRVQTVPKLDLEFVTVTPPTIGPYRHYQAAPNVIGTIDATNENLPRIFPLADGAQGYEAHYMSPNEGPFIGSKKNSGTTGIRVDLMALHRRADINPVLDRSVGLVSMSYFSSFHSAKRGAAGITIVSSPFLRGMIAASTNTNQFNIVAHETAHTFGLWPNDHEEYNDPNWNRDRVSGVNAATLQTVENAKCFMGRNDPATSYWMHWEDYEDLRSALINPPPLEPLTADISTTVNYKVRSTRESGNKKYLVITNSVDAGRLGQMPWYTTEKADTAIDAESPYRLRLLDKFGSLIEEVTANFARIDMSTKPQFADGILIAKVPFYESLAAIEVVHGDEVLERQSVVEKLLSDAVIGLPPAALTDSGIGRDELLKIVSEIGDASRSFDNDGARWILEQRLETGLSPILAREYQKSTALDYDRHEVADALSLVRSMLQETSSIWEVAR